ncbi:g5744 [Coccomyxa viridis]|uniref:G5744 protein n=1 Tax=Coccomyxa viridis TaxID=1274662 RepID=A0ABP1FXJ0_9CHLO
MEAFAERLRRQSARFTRAAEPAPTPPPPSVPKAVAPAAPDHRKLLTRIEELTIQLETSHEVNKHLNGEVESLVLQVDELQKENEALTRHTQELTEKVTAEKRKAHSKSHSSLKEPASAPAEYGNGKDSVPLNALENGCTPEDLYDGTSNGDYLADQRWTAVSRVGEAAGWLIDPGEIVLGSLLGKGMFGQTYLGCWRGGDLAVKCVRVSKESEAASFLREVAALAAIRHPNVMQFYGACLKPPDNCWLLCEYLPGGTLSHWLHGERLQGGRGGPRRSLSEKLRMALGVAQGMQALEAAEPPILHRDLKPSNVFINAAGRPCVADMGLARRLTPASAATLTGETGTYVYMAPEMIRHELYTTKADVYSWGVLLAECLAQRPPYEGLYLTPVQVALSVGDDQLRPTLPSDTPEPVANVALACYDSEPENRPSFALIVHHLRQICTSIEAVDREQAQSESSISRFFKQSRPAVAQAAPQMAGT